MSKNFFQEALRDTLRDRHLNQAQLSEMLGVDPAYISRWLRGSSPRIGQMREVLGKLGWTIERARPDYDPFADVIDRMNTDVAPEENGALKAAEKKSGYKRKGSTDVEELLKSAAENHRVVNTPPAPLIGSVSTADSLVELRESDSSESFDTLDSLFPEVPFAENALGLLRVIGSDLEPEFREGDLLAVRRILQPAQVPDGTLVVLQGPAKHASCHLRRMIRVADRSNSRTERLVGVPISPKQDYVFYKPREVRMLLAVVGSISVRA